eukprot:TRINITY_DN2027_c0_g1_i1.p1 TRINITY_DN2027_c0_g1~~TRINITY_DN2027_c0_g1_i1.p1  ORF type:complete len:258 (-),score=53.68 TRINITY_DN2027_c0_g1_i1:99-872(-)
MEAVVGFTTMPLEGRFSLLRTQETNLANFISDIVMCYLDADAYLGNAGTIRNDSLIPAGLLTFGDIKHIIPWSCPLELAEVTGQKILDALENSVSKYPAFEGRFPMVSGITFAFDPNLEPSKRVKLESVKIGGKAIDLAKTYRLASNYFMTSHGRDGYTMLKTDKLLINEEHGYELTKILLHFFGFKTSIRKTTSAEPLLLRRTSSLARRSKCLELSMKLIFDTREHNGTNFVVINPTEGGRIVNLATAAALEVKSS